MSVLIVTLPGDLHALAVQWAIERLGGEAKIIYPADLCAGAQWAFDPAHHRLLTSYGSATEELDFEKFKTVWMRRPQIRLPQEGIDDQTERASSEDDFSVLARSVYHLVENGRFAVNPIDRTTNAGLKPYQFALANAVGLDVPRTMMGNHVDGLLQFYEACDGNVVFKPFKSAIWQTSRGPAMVPTTRLSREMLDNCDISAAPGIFQEFVRKTSEVRVTIMGDTVFAWEKAFADRTDLDVDWRFMFKDAIHTPHRLPDDVLQACFELMRRLDLVFGCFDFARDQHGRYFFLEVNPQGQWLWGDSIGCGFNQLEAMAEFLMNGDSSFQYSERNSVNLAEYHASADPSRNEAEQRDHYGHLMTFAFGQVTFRVDTAMPS